MKRTLLLLMAAATSHVSFAQYVYTINADSVKITNHCDTAELIIENHTQNVPGFLFNKGRGRTEFRRAQKLNDSTLIVGNDTLVLRGVSTWWSLNGNTGTNPSTNFIGTKDNQPLVFRTNDSARARINANGNLLIGTSTDNNARVQILGAGNNAFAPPALAVYGPGSDMLTLNYTNNATGSNTFGIRWNWNSILNADIHTEADSRILHYVYYGLDNPGLGRHVFEVGNGPGGGNATEKIFAVSRTANGSGIVGSSILTGSQSGAALAVNPNWNTTASPTAFALTLTNTASAPSSLLMDLQTNGASKLAVKATGNVGINTNSPQQALHVKGQIQADSILTGTDTDSLLVVNNAVIRKIRQQPVLYVNAMASGDGSSTTINVSHSLGSTPSFFNVTATSATAANISYVTADGANIVIHYNTAPPSGTNNLSYNIMIRR